MATIVKRGARNAPRFYIRYDYGLTSEGKRRQCFRLLKGVQERRDANQELARVEREIAAGRDPFPELVAPASVQALMERWRDSLKNRNADDDRSRIDRHLVPRFGKMTLDEIGLPQVLAWIDHLAETDLAPQSQRHALNCLSRFFAWCIDRGLGTSNPVREIPNGRRPVAVVDRARPWLNDDSKVPELVKALGTEVGLMFYLCNRSGMRLGEACGLTMGDLDFLREGVIRVAHSYGGPLKEDKRGEGKVKFVPAPIDAEDVLKLHLARRRLHGAKAEDLVFPFTPAKPQNRRRTSSWTGYRKEHVEWLWEGSPGLIETSLPVIERIRSGCGGASSPGARDRAPCAGECLALPLHYRRACDYDR